MSSCTYKKTRQSAKRCKMTKWAKKGLKWLLKLVKRDIKQILYRWAAWCHSVAWTCKLVSHFLRGRMRRMSPQDQVHNPLALSCCCCTKAKCCCIRRLKMEKTGDMKRRAPSPSFAHSELFREKPWAQHVLLLMPQWLPRALKGLQSLDLHSTCSLQTQRRPPKWEGKPPGECC